VASLVRIIESESFDDIEAFRSDWDHLASLKRWPLSEFTWLRNTAKFVAGHNVVIYGVYRDNALDAAIALSRTAGGFLEPVGSAAFFEATPLLSRDADATSKLINHLFTQRTPFSLSRVLEAHTVEPYLSQALAGKGFTRTRQTAGAPYLRLPTTPAEFRDGLSSARRNMLARKRRKLTNAGAVEFKSIYPSSADVATELSSFEQLEANGWKGRQGSAIVTRPGFHDFFLCALHENADRRRVRIDKLTLDATTIAIQFGLVCYGRYFLIKPTFDERLSEFSPGHQLTYEAIQQSILDGLETYEFLGSAEPWKLLWTDTVRPTRSWIHYPFNGKGLGRFAVDALRTLARRFRYSSRK
jgi:CelD/BcsL family acetyltransferase involved in cellulose biosynthesis